MMKWVFSGLILLSVIFGGFSGRISQVSNAALSESVKAVELILKIGGSICMWSGVMKVAERSGLTKQISRILSPITTRIFSGLPKESKALQLISMNITANLLGLGNAATPLGIAAMKELRAQQPPERRQEASNDMVALVVLNTASIQLLPTTIAILRLQYGAVNPLDILPAILVSSFVSVFCGIFLCKIVNSFQKKHIKSVGIY